MANGTAKVKSKTQKEIKKDYYDCVIGLTLLISNRIFNKCLGIKDIIISSYTQKSNAKTTKKENKYIYSSYLKRTDFTDKNFTIFENYEKLIDEITQVITVRSDLTLN